MRAEEFMQLLRVRPFVPLRLHMTDGQTYDIRHPDLVIVLQSRAVIGIAPNPTTGVVERTEHLSLFHIVRVEELQTSGTPHNGPAS
ncbi:MAG TPA: hypothetical protein VN688_25325 [Gemmataceae bacterium]|nr:hypothetical protein [Gemmataceae bacterium]